MDIQDQARKALDVLESSEVLGVTDDSVTLRVERDLWEAFVGEEGRPNQDHLFVEVADRMRAWVSERGMTLEQAFRDPEYMLEVLRLMDEVGINPNEEGE